MRFQAPFPVPRFRLDFRSSLILLTGTGLVLGTALSLFDPRAAGLLGNTVLVAAAVALVAVPIGSSTGWLIAQTDVPGRRLALPLLAGLLGAPPYVLVGAWLLVAGAGGFLPVAPDGLPWLSGFRAAVFIHALLAIPWATIFAVAACRHGDRDWDEAAALVGSPWRAALRVAPRRLAPAAALSSVWIVLQTGGDIAVTDFFGVRTYAEELYVQTAVEPDLTPPGVLAGAAACAWLAAAAFASCLLLVPRQLQTSPRDPFQYQLGRGRWPAATALAVVLALVVFVPLAALTYQTGLRLTPTADSVARSYSPFKSLAILAEVLPRHRLELGWSVATAALTATLVALLATAAALVSRLRPRAAPALWLVAAALLAVPAPLAGLWLLSGANALALGPAGSMVAPLVDRTVLLPVLAQSWRSLPLALALALLAARQIPDDLVDSLALASGPGRGHRARLWLRLLAPGLAAAWLASAALALGEATVNVLVEPPGITLAAVRCFTLLHWGVDDRAAALCLALALVSALATIPAVRILAARSA
jgi:iron(III) transport system permease protein